MALNFTKFFEGIRIKPKSASAADSLGEVEVLSSDNKIRFHNGSSSSPLIAETQVAAEVTIDNIKVDGNTVSSLDTNGDINLSPNGTGTVVVNTDLDVDNINVNGNTISSTNANGNISLDPNGTGDIRLQSELNVLEITTPGTNPAAGRLKIYAKADNKLYTLNAGGTEVEIGSGAGGTNSLLVRWTLENALIPYTNIEGSHMVQATQSLTSVSMSLIDSGSSGSTTIQVNQYRSGSLLASATASIASASSAPASSSSSLSAALSLVAGDILTVDLLSIAGGAPASLSVEMIDFVIGAGTGTSAFTAIYPFTVGSAADVLAGAAGYSSFASAQTAASNGDRITFLRGTHTANITVSKQLKIDGLGHGSIISGTVTFTSSADYSSLKDVKVTDDITLNSGADGIVVRDIWLANGKTFIDNGTGNLLEAIEE